MYIGTFADLVVRSGDQFNHSIFKDFKINLICDNSLHSSCILILSTLSTSRSNGWTATCIEGLALESCCIGVDAHLATEGIKLIDKVTLCESADGWVAGHLGDRRFLCRHEKCLNAHASCSKGSFSTGVTSANDNDIEFFYILHDGKKL